MKKTILFFLISSAAFTQSRNAVLTLYKDGYGLVKQPVTFDLPQGRSTITFGLLPDKLEPNSPLLILKNTQVLYQRYNYDVFNSFEYLKDHLGETVTVNPTDGKSFKGTLLDLDGNWITLLKGKTIRVFNLGRVSNISVNSLSEAENVRSELLWEVISNTGGVSEGQLIYISAGFDWDANYRLVVTPDESSGMLISQAVVKNVTDLDYTNVQLQLVEGELRRLQRERRPRRAARGRQPTFTTMRMTREEAVSFTEEVMADYHFYSLSERLSFPRNESITVSLYPEREISFSRLYMFENSEQSSKEEPLSVQISFKNNIENNLGIPLPAGSFQIYHSRAEGSIEFSGEDFLKQVTTDEDARVIAGRAFDVLGKRTVVNYDRKKKSEEATISLEIKNKRDNDISVRLMEHIHGDWVIKNPSDDYKKVDSQTIQFDLTLRPQSTETVSYTYRKEWQ